MTECFYGDPTIEYFYSDIILDPVSKEAGRLIGKEVYASLIPARCLMIANGRCKRPYRCFLESIEPESTLPFYVRAVSTDNSESVFYKSFPCIISKKGQAELERFSLREMLE